MMTGEEAIAFGLSFAGAYLEEKVYRDGRRLVKVKDNQKTFLRVDEREGLALLKVKADPEKAFFWKDIYKLPDRNTIILDGSVPDETIRMMIAESFDLVSDSPTKRIYEAVKKIPFGCVATYAQVAEAAGDRKMARAVGNALHKNPDPEHIPCFRVVNAKGELSGEFAFGGLGAQAKRLEAEGVEVKDAKVDLKRYQWKP